jgi:hypothetical protein
MNPGIRLTLASDKLRDGNPGKKQSKSELEKQAAEEPKPDVLSEKPEPTRKLKGEARKEWDRACSELVPTGRLTVGRLSALTELCMLHAYTDKLWDQGAAPNAALLAQKRLMYESFGLTAASIGKTKSLNASKKESKLSEFLKRRA